MRLINNNPHCHDPTRDRMHQRKTDKIFLSTCIKYFRYSEIFLLQWVVLVCVCTRVAQIGDSLATALSFEGIAPREEALCLQIRINLDITRPHYNKIITIKTAVQCTYDNFIVFGSRAEMLLKSHSQIKYPEKFTHKFKTIITNLLNQVANNCHLI